jgi:hypothetical protein
VPAAAPLETSAANSPRVLPGALSIASSGAAADSPPSEKPCRKRRQTRTIGAAMPMLSNVGISPIAVVDAPISTSVATIIGLRPTRSPKWAKTTPPSGRAAKPTANTPKPAMVPASGLSVGKNRRLSASGARNP